MYAKLTIPERLKDLRVVDKHLTLEQLAEQTGLSKSALGKYETDDYKDISPFAIATLADFYGVSTDYLMGLTENKNHPNTELQSLHLSDDMVELLSSGKINNRLLCELAAHPNFRRLMIDMEICIDQIANMRVEQMNLVLEATRQTVMSKYAPGEDDLYMRTLELGQVQESDFYSHVMHDDLDSIVRDIREAHRKDKTTADPQPTLDDVKEKFEQALEQGSQRGSGNPRILRQNADTLREDFLRGLLCIFADTEPVQNAQKSQQHERKGQAAAVLCAQAEETQITGKPPNLYRWTAFDPFVGGIKYVVIHPLADRFHQLFHKLPETDAIFEAQPVKEALAFCTRIENRITVVSYSVLLFLRQCADCFFILVFQAKAVLFFLRAGFCLPPLSKLALHPLLNHQINQFFYICTHKRPSLCWADIIPVCFQDGI